MRARSWSDLHRDQGLAAAVGVVAAAVLVGMLVATAMYVARRR